MIRKLLALAVGVALCAPLSHADEKDKADATKPTKTSLEITYLSISRKIDDKNFGWSSDSMSLTLKVAMPGKILLGVDDTSKVSELKDDKGKSLITTDFWPTSFGTSPTISNDRNSMLVYVNSRATPTKGASKITLKGNLVALCGKDEKTTEAKEVEMKLSKEGVKIGDYTLKVTQEKGFGTNGASFSITWTGNHIKSATIKDADGKEVETYTYAPYKFANQWNQSFTLKKVVAKPKITITYYTTQEKVTVPVELSFGIGF